MNDLLIVKTKNIDKVKIQRKQLIFCDDSSIYFDYSDTLRLRNVGIGATLVEFAPNKHYEEGDLVLYQGRMYRAKQSFTPKQFRCCDWEFMGCQTGGATIDAKNVIFDKSASGLDLKTVQDVLDNIISRIVILENGSDYECVLGTF